MEGEKTRTRNLQYEPRRRGQYSKILITSPLCMMRSGTISIHAERILISDVPRKQNEEISTRR